jgi:Flp pilus assembly protein TadB
MIDRARWGTTTEWVVVAAAIYSAVILGAGAWVSVTTGNWLAFLLAVALTAPVEVFLFTRQRRRTATTTQAEQSGVGDKSFETVE